VEAARADVLVALVDLERDGRDGADPVRRELQVHGLGLEQRGVLTRERVLGLGENLDEVALGEGFELDADREAPLHLRNEVAHLSHVERAGGDEEDVIGLHHAVFGRDGGPFDDGAQVALDALA
jgi:hypothetical protein